MALLTLTSVLVAINRIYQRIVNLQEDVRRLNDCMNEIKGGIETLVEKSTLPGKREFFSLLFYFSPINKLFHSYIR